ncbi:MAG: hypothetical protein LBE06_08255 [Azoarcus sp.]|jgi:hypothetical protein|nr:hypothetical protein [Azoarcus sp.]
MDVNTLFKDIVIPLASVAILWWQLGVQRKHNRFSVKPHLDTWIDKNKYRMIFI